ncbi:ArnT family glycosyltransferase [Flavobacterium taihuense]|uniref:Glycosyltransferase family 39 protein n=1 Tax=Flavobacterium taihuense TaxID=2857508 RepID=A0ABS6Y0R8_9FLAO|nr:glycosyltransferase family 39 protein [Flavobacterium taihuense]MBW4361683.1 glycosyltransferase family 39 protein [Flavobacterium taihuense]
MNTKFSVLITKHPVTLILLVIFAVTLFQLGSWGLTETSEARYAQIAKEMIDSGDYIHPTKMGISHYHKPPLTYYITTLGYSLFGINEFGARFFLSIALLAQLILIYKTSLLLFNDRKGSLLTVALYFSTPLILASARNLTTDAYLNTFVLMAVYFWLRYLEEKKYFFLFYLALSLGFFTKGPLVFIPVFVFQLTWLYYNKKRIKFSIYDFCGVILFLISCGWWYLAVILKNPLVLNYFTSNQIYQRIVSNDAFNRGKAFWYYLAFLPLSLFPWIIYLFLTLKKIDITSIKRKILLVSFVLIILIFSAFKTKLIFYVLPSLNFLIMFASNQLTQLSENYWKKFTIYLNGYFILLFSVAFAAIVIRKIEFDLPYVLIILFGLLISILGIKNTSWFYKNVYTLLINSLTLLLFSTFIMRSNELLINSVKPIASFVNTLKSKNVYIYNYLLPSMSFYTNKNIITVNNGNYTCKREVQFEENLNYLKNYYNLEENKEIIRFNTDFKTQNTVFLVRKKEILPTYIKTEIAPFRNKKYFGKWILYYN